PCFFGGAKGVRREAVFGQALGQGPRHGRLVLDDQDVWHRGWTPGGGAVRGGRVAVRVPRAGKARGGSRSCTSRATTGPRNLLRRRRYLILRRRFNSRRVGREVGLDRGENAPS